MKTLIILRGLPGAGKTTLANIIAGNDKSLVCCADDYFTDDNGNYNFNAEKLGQAHNYCKGQCEMLMQNNEQTVIVANTSTTEKELAPYQELAAKYGYMVISCIVENRHGNQSVHNVPNEAMDRMEQRFNVKLR